MGRGEGARHRREVRGQAGHRHRGIEALDAEPAAALRPHDAPARGQRAVRLLGAHDALARAGALREAQGADLSAHRLARAAGGLSRHRAPDDGGARGDGPLRRARPAGAEGEVDPAEQADLRQRQGLRPLRDHPDADRAEAPVRGRAEALRLRRQALPRGVPSGRRVPRHHADHARGGRAVQDRGQGPRRARLARRLRQGGGRRERVSGAGEAGREGGDRQGRRPEADDAPAAALQRRHAPLRDGGRGQDDRGRGAARGDAREGARHAGDARADHRGADRRALRAPRGQGADPHGEGVLADDAAARPGRAGALQPRAHGRVGVPARPDGARQARARRVHEGHRRDDEAHRRAGEELRERHDPRRLRDARRALSEVRRRGAREVQEVPVRPVRLRLLEDPGRPPARAGRGRGAAARPRDRAARRLPQPDRPAVLGEAPAQRRERGRVRLRPAALRRRRRSARLHRAGAARAVPEVQ